ncbi:hypothetical protein F2Q68_00033522 [Brassica cretica]|uniref:Uncharacterized protein n=1 Tax=Brassica cretica TaxID=69181 RepID=A0A8S9H486_BRACR|nr:hypothetical protein F2Q68_00033522 [Brassica cretica]
MPENSSEALHAPEDSPSVICGHATWKKCLSASPVPQTGVPGIRHSTFESLRVGCSSQSIASNLLAYGIP